ncbi:hypothetical protein KIH41_15520 [Litoribacter ruber]|uniref:Uncharacterized protein n=1 Tax=Litoribacter ruber TaxID=702568 RepID=A0AAP2G1S9_9BACT|nr:MULTISPECIES: hypothetical protein [Litoribacter]MBS9524677.1 hypothetical protein [Litoribacter alkaliphilus]MBT0812697.1 hypothetical protein [Litoribacter ruber]
MKLGKNYFEFGVKYGVPLMIIGSTLAMRKAKGLGNLLVFSIVTPAMLAYVYSLSKAKGEID